MIQWADFGGPGNHERLRQYAAELLSQLAAQLMAMELLSGDETPDDVIAAVELIATFLKEL